MTISAFSNTTEVFRLGGFTKLVDSTRHRVCVFVSDRDMVIGSIVLYTVNCNGWCVVGLNLLQSLKFVSRTIGEQAQYLMLKIFTFSHQISTPSGSLNAERFMGLVWLWAEQGSTLG